MTIDNAFEKFMDLVLQKDCPECGNPVNTSYPFYRNDGSQFVRCEKCGTVMEV